MARLRFRGGVWYYRAKLPADVRKLINRTELTYSLRTADPESAVALSLEMQARQLRLCRAIRQTPRMTSDQVDALVGRYMQIYRENREEDSIVFGEFDPAFAGERRAFLRTALQEAQDDFAFNRLDSAERLANWLLQETGASLDDYGVQRLRYRLLAARVDLLKDEVSRLPETPQAAPQDAPVQSPQVSALVTDYLAHREVHRKPQRSRGSG